MSDSRVQRLTDSVSLEDIRFFSIQGDVDATRAGEEFPEESDLQIAIEVGPRADEAGLIALLTATWTNGPMRLHVVVGGLYAVEDSDIEYDNELLGAFSDQVAMFQLLPFAREGIASLATRLRVPPPLIPLKHRLNELQSKSDEAASDD